MAEEIYLFFKGEKSGPHSREKILEKFSSQEIDMTAQIKINGVWHNPAMIEWLTQTMSSSNNFESEDVLSTEAEQEITCPHCWHIFNLAQINFIAKHLDLVGDPVLGPEAQRRFLPVNFNAQGYAIDAKGLVCQDMACPHCHLQIPEAIIDTPSSLFSIVGAPASGKSYFLTALIWQMRKVLAQCFDYTLTDTDATFNSVLNNYEQILFLNRQQQEFVALPKTELQGHDFSNQVILNELSIDLPLPFIFTLTPTIANRDYDTKGMSLMRNIILYDNAGEHFEPGRDQVTNQATLHLIHSDGIIFLYDPIKDSRMVTRCDNRDPQVTQLTRGANQLVLLNEMIARIRKYAGMKIKEKYHKPLIMVIPKYDAWKDTFAADLEECNPIYYSQRTMTYSLNLSTITNISYMMREDLMRISPEVVAACEAFFSTVYFIPVSALGRMPEYDQEKDMIAIKPDSLKPIWAEVPMLLQFWHAGLIHACDFAISNAIPVENYLFTADSLICTFPGSNIRQTLPRLYWGRTVYSQDLQAYFKLPMPPQPAEPQEVAEKNDSDFWSQ